MISGAPFKSVEAAAGQGQAYGFTESGPTVPGRPHGPDRRRDPANRPHEPGPCRDVLANRDTIEAYGDCVQVTGNGNEIIEPGPGSSVTGNANTVVAPQGPLAVNGTGNRVLDPPHRAADPDPGAP